MTPQDVLAQLHERGVSVQVKDGELVVRAARGAMDDGLMAMLKQHKAELITLLENASPAVTGITPQMLPLVQLSQEEIDEIVEGIPGGVANIQDIYPLAPLQEGMLFQHLLGGDGDAYLLRTTLEFNDRGTLDAFVDALGAIIARHDILRTGFQWEGLSTPVQVVQRRAPLHISEVIIPAGEDCASWLDAHTDPRHRRLDLRHAPLLHAHVAQDGDRGCWRMSLWRHHLVCDHVTMELLLGEVAEVLAGRGADLPPPQPYRNFIARTRAVPADRHEAYFRERLSDIDMPTAPFDVLDVHGQGESIQEHRQVLSEADSVVLRAEARRLGVSPAAVFHLAWARVLAMCCGQDDVVFGTVLSGRLQIGNASQVVGMFINTLPIRITVGTATIEDTLLSIQHDLGELLEHEQASLALAQRCSGVAAPLPLFSSLLNYRHSHRPVGSGGPVDAVWQGIRLMGAEERTNYPMVMAVEDWGTAFGLTVQCSQGLDAPRIARYMNTAVQSVLSALGMRPTLPVRSLAVMDAAERERVLEEFNATDVALEIDDTVHGLFEAQVRRTPDAPAVRLDDAGLSYSELNRRANRLAHHLIGQGVRPDDRVAIHVERSIEMVVGLLGILKAGAAYVPLDPSYPVERLGYMLTDCEPSLLLTDSALLTRLDRGCLPRTICLDTDAALWEEGDDTDPDPQTLGLTPLHLAYIIYTSGSTGRPKGAMNEHRSVVNRLLWAQSAFALDAADRVLQKTPCGFDVSVWEFFLPLLAGAELVLAQPSRHREPDYLAALVTSADITVAHFVPSMLQVFLANLSAGDCASLRHVLCSGEALPHALQMRFFAALPHTNLHNLYGPTEAAVDVTWWRCEAQRHAGRVPIGYPIANTRMYVLDRHGSPSPIGVSGELVIGGVQVGRGYWRLPELTDERFVPDPFARKPGARMYRTGDLGRWLPDGAIEYLGRNDFQVKIRGFRIELGEIEARLMACPGVGEAVVLARQDAAAEIRLVAYVVMREGGDASPGTLRQALAGDLPEYMVPGAFVMLDALPLSPNGKLDRKALPAPDMEAVTSRHYAPAQTAAEHALVEAWQALLGVERVGRHDHFFELGGHSLLVIGLIERLRRSGYATDVRTVFTTPVLHELAANLEARDGDRLDVAFNAITEATARITPDLLPLVALSQAEIDALVERIPGGVANVQDIYPLAPLQEGILFHHLLEQDSEGDAYLMRSVIAFERRDRLDVFLEALHQVIARHDILRTSVHWQDLPRPVQVVHRRAELPVEMLAPIAGSDALDQLLARTDTRKLRFELGRAPLLRAYVIEDRASGEWLLALLNHHLVDDNYSLQLLLREVQTLLRGEGDLLPPAMPYRNFIARTEAMDLSGHEAYFRAQLGTVEETTAPFGIVDVRAEDTKVSEARSRLPMSMARRLRDAARRHAVPAAVLFHVAWAQVVAKCSGRGDVVFGTVLSGRLQGSEGADQVVGMFINTLPVRFDVENLDAIAAVEQMQRQLLDLLQYEQASLALAQRCSNVPPPLPLFTALMNYRHSNAVTSQAEIEAAALAWEGMRSISIEARNNYPLTMSVEDLGEAFGLTALAVDGIDPQRLVGYMEQALCALLDALETGAQQPLRQLAILPAAERQLVVHGFNRIEECTPDEHVVGLFAAQVARTPQAPAIAFGGLTLDFATLDRQSSQLAQRLVALGVRPDDRVAICVERGVQMGVGLLGIWKAGAGYVPLDPGYPQERLAYMLQDSAPRAVVSQGDVLASLELSVAVPLVDLDDATLAAEPTQAPAVALEPQHLAYMIYTSGSTGQPKGVMIEHRSPVNFWRAMRQSTHRDLPANARVAVNAAYAFDMSLKGWLQWLSGHCVMPVPQQIRASGPALLAFLEQERIDALDSTPSQLEGLLAAGLLEGTGHRPRSVLLGGEAIGPALWARLRGSERIAFFNMYGPTECTVDATLIGVREAGATPTIGRPIRNVPVYILDGQGEPVPVGVAGELCIGGVQVARGYWNRAQLSAERFVPDRFSADPQARMYRTGDLGRWRADGTIEYLGRNDFQVKIRGFRIELGEIEAQLLACADVREAVVVARAYGEGDTRLVAYVVMAPGVACDVSALRQVLLQRLAEYMVPSAFVALEALPLTANGKLDRQALPAPETAAVAVRAYEAPHGEIEEAIAAIWQDLLGVERVGRHDHFFELGGHSLMVIGLIERLRQRGHVTDVRSVFTAPILSALAERMGAERQGGPTLAANPITPQTTRLTPELLPLVRLEQAQIDQIVAQVPGGVPNIQDIYPLAPLQEGILFHHLLEQEREGDAYLMRSVVAFADRARLDAFLWAMQQMIDRHDILRSAMQWQGLPQPVQVVHRQARLPVQELAVDAGQDALAQLQQATDPRRHRVPVSQAPVMRAFVVEDPVRGEWLLALLRHHLVCDHVAMDLLLSEIQTLLGGGTLPPARPYRHFIAQMQHEDVAAHEAYFRQQLGDIEEPSAPFGVMDVRHDGAAVNEARSGLPLAMAQAIRRQSRQLGVSPAVLFHVAWARVVGQCSGRDGDVVFGTVLSGRLQGSEGADQVVGMFLNTLPVRIGQGADARGSVAAVHEQLSALLEHEQASLALAQRCSGVAAPLPLFTSLLNYRHSHAATPEESAQAAQAWEGMRLIGGDTRNNYPLTMSVEDLGEAFGLTALAVDGIDPQRLVGYMEQALCALLDALETGAQQPLRQLAILPAAERQLVVHGFNRIEECTPDEHVVGLFAAQVARTPQAPAIAFGGQTLDFATLDRQSSQLAQRLVALGVRPDDRVAICVERGVQMGVGLLGIWKAGAGYVPLDPGYPQERLAYMLQDSAPRAVVSQGDVLASLELSVAVPLVDLDDATLAAEPTQAPAVALEPQHLAYMIYTSGSTGQPKGVMIEHRSPVNFWRAMRQSTHRDLPANARVAVNAAYAFDMSLKGWLQWLSGHCVMPVPQQIRASGPALLAFLEQERIDALDSTPSQLEGLLAAGLLEGTGHRPRSVLLGGEAIGPALWARLRGSERIAFFNMYGPTECTVDATLIGVREAGATPTIGRPIRNVPVYILDGQGEPVPVGVAGELCIGGVQVARGYWNRAQLSAERFVPDRFSADPQARMYRTGDLGRWRADGTIEYLGRNDFQVKIRGFRIELGEIEAQLLACADVREAVVVARAYGEGDTRLVAYVVMAPGVACDVSALRQALLQRLAEYMVPSAFVALEALPLTANGKLDRQALPAPETAAVPVRAYEAPHGEIEEAIAAIWQDLLGVERVGRHDHFFELGGHSLLAVQLMVRLRDTFYIEVPLRELFEQPILQVLADVIQAQLMLGTLEDEIRSMDDELDGLTEAELLAILKRESVNE